MKASGICSNASIWPTGARRTSPSCCGSWSLPVAASAIATPCSPPASAGVGIWNTDRQTCRRHTARWLQWRARVLEAVLGIKRADSLEVAGIELGYGVV